ncbi:Tn3 family transposase, partial [Streptomyces albiflaviniger]|nr:Tn3 family transposase [Streptomyces albiflaviniger]
GQRAEAEGPLPRYVTTAFVYGSGLGPAQAVRHMRGSVGAHELGAIAKRHFTIPVLNRCGADVVNAHVGLDLTAAWRDGSVAAVDGAMMDIVIDNLPAETSIRYGGYGGIAHHLVPPARHRPAATDTQLPGPYLPPPRSPGALPAYRRVVLR